MARKPRLHVPGGVYHVMLRGNAGQDIFFGDEDRYRLYVLLQEGVERFGQRIHAFCLMSNHLHLAVQVADVPLSRSMQNLSFRYTRWVNARQGRGGHLFQGRYQAILVDADSYLLELVRYLHLNPVRAGLVEDPQAYPWSSHRAYMGEETVPWLTTGWVLGQFAKRLATCRKRYAAFVRTGDGEGYREVFHRGGEADARVLGPEPFRARVLAAPAQTGEVPSLGRIVRGVCTAYGTEEGAIAAPGRRRDLAEVRAMVGYLATTLGSAMLTEVAGRFGRDVATLSHGVRRLTTRMRTGQLSQRAETALRQFGIKYQDMQA